MVARFGTEVQNENHRGYNDPYSQEAQARFYLQRLDILRSLECDGSFIDSYNDHRLARPSLCVRSGDPWVYSSGLVSAEREKRMAFDAVRASFHGEKFPALPIGAYSNRTPVVFVLAGFALLVGMVYLYNSSRRFREGLNRSLLNSYNFFADIRDEHPVSVGHTVLLAAGISAGVGLTISAIAFHFRDSWLLDNMLSLVLVSDAVKAAAVRTIWTPLLAIGVIVVISMIMQGVLSLVLYSVRVFFRQRVYLWHTFTVTIWSSTPLLIFIPIGMILYRVMESPTYVTPMLMVFVLAHMWVVGRIIKGISIVYDVSLLRISVGSGVFLLAICGLLWLYYDTTASIVMYIQFMFHLTSLFV